MAIRAPDGANKGLKSEKNRGVKRKVDRGGKRMVNREQKMHWTER